MLDNAHFFIKVIISILFVSYNNLLLGMVADETDKLQRAIRHGDLVAAQEMLGRGNVDINRPNLCLSVLPYSFSVLDSIALHYGCERLLSFLESYQLVIEHERGSALKTAVDRGNYTVAKWLIEHGADLTIFKIKNFLPRHCAFCEKYNFLNGFLMSYGATSERNWEELERIESQDGGIDNVNENLEETYLHHFASLGNFQMVGLLVHRGANVNVCNEYEETPLHSAATSDNPNVVAFLLNHGADCNATTSEDNSTPLMYAQHLYAGYHGLGNQPYRKLMIEMLEAAMVQSALEGFNFFDEVSSSYTLETP